MRVRLFVDWADPSIGPGASAMNPPLVIELVRDLMTEFPHPGSWRETGQSTPGSGARTALAGRWLSESLRMTTSRSLMSSERGG